MWLARATFTTAILSVLTLPARGQSPGAPAASTQNPISGRVVADNTSTPLPNVRITVTGVPLGAPLVVTDADGRFSVVAPSGRFSVVASKSGYALRGGDRPTSPGGGDAWQDPEFLDALIPRASTATITEGLHLSLNLRVATGPRR